MRVRLNLIIVFLCLSGCASSFLKYDKSAELKENKEFDKEVVIVKADEAPESASPEAVASSTPIPSVPLKSSTPDVPPAKDSTKTATKAATKITTKINKAKVTASKSKAKPVETQLVRQPDLEDTEGFAPGSRRPLVDPFRVGEEVVHNVHYFKVSAGELKIKVEPFSMVNNRKSYTFAIEIKTSSLFNAFYSVQDRVETFVDFEDLVPRVFQLHVKESGQLREAKMLFDTDKNMAKFWEKKVTKDGEEEKREEWEIPEFSQNVYSAVFYMRNFKWDIGKEYAFRVANDKENLVFSGKALRKEVLNTKLGPKRAIVIQPNIHLKGQFKPIGDNFIWISDDEHKYILRIESKIKIGTLVSEVISIKPGKAH